MLKTLNKKQYLNNNNLFNFITDSGLLCKIVLFLKYDNIQNLKQVSININNVLSDNNNLERLLWVRDGNPKYSHKVDFAKKRILKIVRKKIKNRTTSCTMGLYRFMVPEDDFRSWRYFRDNTTSLNTIEVMNPENFKLSLNKLYRWKHYEIQEELEDIDLQIEKLKQRKIRLKNKQICYRPPLYNIFGNVLIKYIDKIKANKKSLSKQKQKQYDNLWELQRKIKILQL